MTAVQTGIPLAALRRVPRTFPGDLFFVKTRNSLIFKGFLPFSIQFSANGYGAPLCAILKNYRQNPGFLEHRGLPCRSQTGISSKIWLHICWPGYEAYKHTLLIDHDGTYGSIAYGVAQAYVDFLQSATRWDFQVNTDSPYYGLGQGVNVWKIADHASAFNVCSLRLVSLNHITADIYQAEMNVVVLA